MKRAMMIAAAVAAIAAWGDDSAFARCTSAVGRLDLRTGMHIANGAERITYSPRWDNAASCTIDLGGSRSVATEEGITTWTPSGTGAHTLTHTAGNLTYTAQFTVLGDDVAVEGGRLSSSAVWGTNKVHLVTEAVTVPSGVSLTIQAGAVVKFMPGTSLTIASGGSCTARGVIFTHVNDDTIGGDTLMDDDGSQPVMGDYTITGSVADDDSTEYRYMPPQTLQSNISTNTRLRGHRCYIVSNSVTVASGATLTLQPGTILKFNTGCSLTVNGTLDAQGTRAAPIVFTSLKDDDHGGDANGDGDKTYVQPGDWHQITGSGTVKLNYCKVLWCSAQNNQGALYPNGGTWQFDNSIVAHCEYDCMRSYGGTFTARNSVFMDSSMGAAPSSGTATFINCVFNYLTTAVRWGNGTFRNCIFSDISEDIIDKKFYSSTLNSKFYNCCFWNPEGTGDHASAKVGQNGCFYADPLFVDAVNGDFRIAANSPCVDAGDGTVAPETDYYGQPRMDVKSVKDTGTPNGDGVCPDIGIYEVPGTAVVPLPDLAVVVVNALAARSTSGDTITVNYVVTNLGAAAASGLVRDLFRFKGADASLGGMAVDAAEIEQAYNLAAGASVTQTATVTVPTLKAGKWKVGVVVNAERDVYEAVLANNSAETEDVMDVEQDSFAVGGSKSMEVASGGVAGAAVTGMPVAGGAVVATLPNGVKFYASVGYVPDETRHDVAGTLLADGRTALFIPAHEEGETVYVVLVNDSGAAQTVTLDALASSDGLEIAKPADVAVTAKGPKVTAKLVLPESIRDGRVYAAWVEYANSGDQDAELPIFTISRTGGGATFSATAKGEYSANPLSLIGLAPSAPRGKLKPGEAGRVAFYILSSGQLSVKLGMVTEKSTSTLNGFSTVAEYRAGMSAAATRLCARGGTDPDFTAVLAQALNEKRGAGGAAVCGTLRNAVTKMPMTGFTIALIATNDLAVVDAVRSDMSGAFALAAPEAGAYTVEVQGVQGNETLIYELTDEDVNGVSIFATPYCVVEGVAMIGAVEPVAGAKVIIDDIRTDKFGDFETETSDDGTFRFTSLLDGEYELFAYPPEGWCMATSGVFIVTNGSSYAHNAVFAERGTKITGSITDAETGNAVTNAAVILTLSAGESISVLTDSEGGFVFNGVANGIYAVDVADNDYELQNMYTLEVTGGTAEIMLPLLVRMKPVFTVMNPIGMVSHTAAFSLIADITSPEWDFDGDGVTDSTEADPSWTYNAVGNYTVTLTYTDAAGARRRSVAENAVEVIETIENVLKAGNVVLTTGCGVAVESVSTNELVLVGAAAASYEPGTVIGMKEGPRGGFIRKVISVRQDGENRFVFAVEPGDLDDLYDEYFFTTDFGFSEEQVSAMMTKSVRRLMAKSSPGDEHKIPLYVEVTTFKPWKITIGGPSSTVTHYSEPVAGSQTCYKTKKGKKVESYKVKNSYLLKLPVTVAREIASNEGANSIKKGKKFINWKGNVKGPGFWGPWGLYFSIQCDYGIEGNVSAEGSVTGEFTLRGVNTVEYRRENGGKEKQKVVERDFSDPGFRIASIAGTVCAEIDAHVVIGVYMSWLKAIGRVGVGAKVGMTLGFEQDLAYNFPGDFVKNEGLKSTFRLTSSLYGAIEVSAKLLNVASAKKHGADLPWKLQWKGQLELGNMNFKTSGTGLTVNFESVNPKIEAEGFLLGVFNGIEVPAVNQVWSFGDWSFGEGRATSHTYEQEGNYLVRLGAMCSFPSSFISLGNPFAKTFSAKVRVYDDKPPEPQETEDLVGKNPSKSCDPNEMDGPDGVGENRLVKPGEWMTYTVYFENKADADVPAQEVRVTNPLSEWLDWSTFEMREVVFCNQVETGLTGKQNDSITVDQDDTNCKVQASVSLDQGNGVVSWYLRSIDPVRADFNYWPPDGVGLLPPNDDTHRGEGHLTYRIKVRGDAPANVIITNSATIVFDTNDPIETDPAWWNTVAPMANVTIDNGEGGIAMQLIVGEPFGELPDPGTRDGYTFGGWYTQPEGQGMRITPTAIVPEGLTGVYAYWMKNEPPQPAKTGPAQPWTAKKAVVLDGAVYDADGKVAGVVQLKVAKPNAKKHNAKISGAVTLLDGKKRALKAAAFNVPVDAPISANLNVKGLGTLSLVIGDDGFEGSVGGYTAAGAKVGGNWTRTDARVMVATGATLPPGTIEELLPDGEPVRVKGGKWAFDKAASIKYAKGVLSGDNDPKKPNRSAMKLTYTPKTGLFKGSFKFYAIQGGKLKKFTVKITGVVVDGEGTGVAKLAKPAVTWSVSVR